MAAAAPRGPNYYSMTTPNVPPETSAPAGGQQQGQPQVAQIPNLPGVDIPGIYEDCTQLARLRLLEDKLFPLVVRHQGPRLY